MSSNSPVPAFVIAYSDSDFTNPHEVVLPDEPHDCRGDFTHMGAKYWGLETSRHRATTINADAGLLEYNHEAHNSITIKLKERTAVSKVTVSTKWFTGNQARAISVVFRDELTGKEAEMLTRVPLRPDAEHKFEIAATVATECHVKIYYEGGLSRINFFGEPAAEQLPDRPNLLEHATLSHISNEHYGHPRMAVKGTRVEMHMKGWESARTGFGEQVLFALRRPTTVEEIVVDTYLHRLNSPLSCHIFGLTQAVVETAVLDDLMRQRPRWKVRFRDGTEVLPNDFQAYMLEQKYLSEPVPNATRFQIMLDAADDSPWTPVLPFAPLRADTWHRFTQFADRGPFIHLLYLHYPNGGIHGLKLFGNEYVTMEA
ncbi:MAG: hypothetical protein AAF614_17330 [Chloroflexota bacterium]